MSLKNLFFLAVTFTSLFTFPIFSLTLFERSSNSKAKIGLLNNRIVTNTTNLQNKEITSFSNDDTNKIFFSLSEHKVNSVFVTNKFYIEFEIFSSPSEKYFGYYLKKYFNVSPLFFINLLPEEQQLYKKYVNENPDKEYLKQHESELLEEKLNPKVFKKQLSSIISSHFSIDFYDVPFGFKVKLDSVFIVDFSFYVTNTILLILSDGTSIEIEIELNLLFKQLKSVILENLGSYEKSSKYLIDSYTTTKTEFDYKSFELTKSWHRENTFRWDIFKVYKGFSIDLLIPHLHYDHWEKCWWGGYPVFDWENGHVWSNSFSNRFFDYSETSIEFENNEKTEEYSYYLQSFLFSLKNYTPSELLEIIDLNKNFKNKFLLPEYHLKKIGLYLQKFPSSTNKNFIPIFGNKPFPVLKPYNAKINTFFLPLSKNSPYRKELDENLKFLSEKKSKLEKAEELFEEWKKNPTLENKKKYLKFIDKFFKFATEFEFLFLPNEQNTKKQIAIKGKWMKKQSFHFISRPYGQHRRFYNIRFFKAPKNDIQSFKNNKNDVSFIVFKESSPFYLQHVTNLSLVPQFNDNLLDYLLTVSETFSYRLYYVELIFLDWYGNAEIEWGFEK